MALHARIGEGNDAATTNRRPHGLSQHLASARPA
jgi:hypothetical protein